MLSITSLVKLSDRDLLAETQRVLRNERQHTAELLALLGEVDVRRLYLGRSCSSLFTYCTQVLHLSEHAAYHRIEAARAARQFPIILDMVAEGALTLTAVAMPFADGGHSDVDNLQLRCRAHNTYEAELYFGTELGGAAP